MVPKVHPILEVAAFHEPSQFYKRNILFKNTLHKLAIFDHISRFMARNVHPILEVVASHEPKKAPIDLQRLMHFRFMAREQVQKEQETFHEPEGVTSDE